LAEEVGKELGQGQVLLRQVPGKQAESDPITPALNEGIKPKSQKSERSIATSLG
jgi:hypothetical protein